MLVKFIKSVKLKFKKEEKFIKAGTVLDLPDIIVDTLANKNKVIKFNPEINENCLQPFMCEFIRENGSCELIELGLKKHCCGPYKVSNEGIFSYLAIQNKR